MFGLHFLKLSFQYVVLGTSHKFPKKNETGHLLALKTLYKYIKSSPTITNSFQIGNKSIHPVAHKIYLIEKHVFILTMERV